MKLYKLGYNVLLHFHTIEMVENIQIHHIYTSFKAKNQQCFRMFLQQKTFAIQIMTIDIPQK